jgi:hypothetical protein
MTIFVDFWISPPFSRKTTWNIKIPDVLKIISSALRVHQRVGIGSWECQKQIQRKISTFRWPKPEIFQFSNLLSYCRWTQLFDADEMLDVISVSVRLLQNVELRMQNQYLFMGREYVLWINERNKWLNISQEIGMMNMVGKVGQVCKMEETRFVERHQG